MAALHCQEAGQTADSRPIIRSMQATRATPALAEETEMTCNKTQRRTHGAANKKGGAEAVAEREYWGLSCPPPVDYNTKWHLTTEIYLANASPESFTEITIAKLACLAGQAKTGSRRPAADPQQPDSRRLPLPPECVVSFVCVNAKSFGLSMPDADNFGLIARSHRISLPASCRCRATQSMLAAP